MNPEDQIKPLPLTPEQQAERWNALDEQRKALDAEMAASEAVDRAQGKSDDDGDDNPFGDDTRLAIDVALILESVKGFDQKLDTLIGIGERIASALEARNE